MNAIHWSVASPSLWNELFWILEVFRHSQQQVVVHRQTCLFTTTRGQSNLTKSASRGAYSPVRGHPRGSKVVPLNSCGMVSY